MNEETISSEIVYSGRALDLRIDKVKTNKGITTREIVEHSSAVSIIPFSYPDTVYLIHQFRKPTDQVLIEIPAGCIEPNESPDEAAKRELSEETGLVAKNLVKVGEMYMAPGFCNEYMHFYVATNFTKEATNLDEDEMIDVQAYSISDFETMIKGLKIIDAKTVLGFYFLNEYLK